MAQLVRQGRTDIRIRELAVQLVGWIPPKHWRHEVEALFNFVRNNIRYVRDIHQVETVATPVKTLEYSAGDCDDMVVLLSALLEAIGYETRFVAMGLQPGHFQHVFLEARLPSGEWMALDPTEPVKAGWRPPGIQSRMVQPID